MSLWIIGNNLCTTLNILQGLGAHRQGWLWFRRLLDRSHAMNLGLFIHDQPGQGTASTSLLSTAKCRWPRNWKVNCVNAELLGFGRLKQVGAQPNPPAPGLPWQWAGWWTTARSPRSMARATAANRHGIRRAETGHSSATVPQMQPGRQCCLRRADRC